MKDTEVNAENTERDRDQEAQPPTRRLVASKDGCQLILDFGCPRVTRSTEDEVTLRLKIRQIRVIRDETLEAEYRGWVAYVTIGVSARSSRYGESIDLNFSSDIDFKFLSMLDSNKESDGKSTHKGLCISTIKSHYANEFQHDFQTIFSTTQERVRSEAQAVKSPPRGIWQSNNVSNQEEVGNADMGHSDLLVAISQQSI
ncbi:hypothetical protein BD414DRAFT_283446 [Trametes punicea]|nr:hypothetical protein BD414DRAFT_283446 [Trametes punicea]